MLITQSLLKLLLLNSTLLLLRKADPGRIVNLNVEVINTRLRLCKPLTSISHLLCAATEICINCRLAMRCDGPIRLYICSVCIFTKLDTRLHTYKVCKIFKII